MYLVVKIRKKKIIYHLFSKIQIKKKKTYYSDSDIQVYLYFKSIQFYSNFRKKKKINATLIEW